MPYLDHDPMKDIEESAYALLQDEIYEIPNRLCYIIVSVLSGGVDGILLGNLHLVFQAQDSELERF